MPAKAEIHCHIEGAASPELVLRQAAKYGVDMSGFIQEGSFVWADFTSFLAAYDAAASLFRTEEDYALLAGSTLAFLAIAATMFATRNEEWYGPEGKGLFGRKEKAVAPGASGSSGQAGG